MHQRIYGSPELTQVNRKRLDLVIFGHIARQHLRDRQASDHPFHRVPLLLIHVSQNDRSAFSRKRFRNRKRQAPLVGHPGNHGRLSFKQFRHEPTSVTRLASYYRGLRRVLILIVILIVYGSLYPWHFAPRQLPGNPIGILLHAWRPAPWPFLLRDIVVNISLYIPLGFVAQLAMRKSRMALYGPVLLALLLSMAVELLTQLYEPVRDTSLIDVTTNVIGSILGVSMAVLFAKTRGSQPGLSRDFPGDLAAVTLASCWVAWLFFPFFPVLGRYELHRKIAVFAHSPILTSVSLVSVVSMAAAWYVAGLLLSKARVHQPIALLAFSILAIPAQFFVVERQPLPSALLGAIAGFLHCLPPCGRPESP